MCICGIIVDYRSNFQIMIGVRHLQGCHKFMTKFTTFVRATCFMNSYYGGTIIRTTDCTCDRLYVRPHFRPFMNSNPVVELTTAPQRVCPIHTKFTCSHLKIPLFNTGIARLEQARVQGFQNGPHLFPTQGLSRPPQQWARMHCVPCTPYCYAAAFQLLLS